MNDQHTLTYQGMVDPKIGQIMGLSMDGRTFSVVGSVYDTKTTAVVVEQIEGD